MIVEIDWFIIATCEPIGFDYFLNGLMTQEAYVKPMPCRIESLCSDNVFIYLFEPFEGYFFSCHFLFIICMDRPPPTNELSSDGAKIKRKNESSKKKRQKKKISTEIFGS